MARRSSAARGGLVGIGRKKTTVGSTGYERWGERGKKRIFYFSLTD
jgi:hypothetical protein